MHNSAALSCSPSLCGCAAPVLALPAAVPHPLLADHPVSSCTASMPLVSSKQDLGSSTWSQPAATALLTPPVTSWCWLPTISTWRGLQASSSSCVDV